MKSAPSRLLLTPAIFERWHVAVYAKPDMSSCKRNTAGKKISWSDDDVELLLNVTVGYIFT